MLSTAGRERSVRSESGSDSESNSALGSSVRVHEDGQVQVPQVLPY